MVPRHVRREFPGAWGLAEGLLDARIERTQAAHDPRKRLGEFIPAGRRGQVHARRRCQRGRVHDHEARVGLADQQRRPAGHESQLDPASGGVGREGAIRMPDHQALARQTDHRVHHLTDPSQPRRIGVDLRCVRMGVLLDGEDVAEKTLLGHPAQPLIAPVAAGDIRGHPLLDEVVGPERLLECRVRDRRLDGECGQGRRGFACIDVDAFRQRGCHGIRRIRKRGGNDEGKPERRERPDLHRQYLVLLA